MSCDICERNSVFATFALLASTKASISAEKNNLTVRSFWDRVSLLIPDFDEGTQLDSSDRKDGLVIQKLLGNCYFGQCYGGFCGTICIDDLAFRETFQKLSCCVVRERLSTEEKKS